MDNENTFAKIVATCLCVMVISVSGCNVGINYDDNIAMKEMVKNGADPIDARCAIKGAHTNACAIRAATKNKELEDSDSV